jgi:voltage-gated potassium channel
MKETLKRERKKLLKYIGRLLEGPMTFLGFVWLLLLIIELVWGLSDLLQYLSFTIWGIFIIDFLVKFLVTPEKIKFFKENWLTALSLIVPALRVFRLFRLLRLLRGVRLIKIVASINRSMRSLAATMKRRGFAYVILLTVVVTFAGAAGMYAIERENPGFESFGMALWWTAMRVITAGSDFWPSTAEGRYLAFILSLFGYAVFGYVTATLATFFIGRDAEEKDAPVAGSAEIAEVKEMTILLNKKMDELNRRLQSI